MQLPAQRLPQHLQGELAPAYFVVGDEQLLVEEACDAVFAAARRAGFDERSLFEATARAPWRALFDDAANLSLFGGKRLLDVRVPARGLDRPGSEALRGYLRAPMPDTMLVCRGVDLEWRVRTSAWYKALEKAAVTVRIRPVAVRDLPRWLEERCRREGLRLEADALDVLAERVEGNLLAARQEIEKLKLLEHSGTIGVNEVLIAVGDSSHYDIFALLDAAFAGDARRVAKTLGSLRQQGVAVFSILAVLAGQLQRAVELASGGNPRLSGRRRELLAAATRRLGGAKLDEIANECALLDMQAKGMLRGDPWQSLEGVLLALTGRARLDLGRYAPWLWSY